MDLVRFIISKLKENHIFHDQLLSYSTMTFFYIKQEKDT